MSDHASDLAKVEPIFRKAMACDACFTCQGSTLQRAPVDIAQPRPIGDDYWTSEVRTVLILISPAAGGGEHAAPDQTFTDLLHGYADGRGSLEAVFRHQRSQMPNWGKGAPGSGSFTWRAMD
jgi:hypothetical protein